MTEEATKYTAETRYFTNLDHSEHLTYEQVSSLCFLQLPHPHLHHPDLLSMPRNDCNLQIIILKLIKKLEINYKKYSPVHNRPNRLCP